MTAYQRIISCYEILLVNREGIDSETLRSALNVKDTRSVRRLIRGLRRAEIPVLVERNGSTLVYLIPKSYKVST